MLECVRIVLCRPQDPRNVGAVCRAMKTMGLTRLVLVGAEHLSLAEARVVAVHAADVLERAVVLPTLAEAVRSSALAVGVTRRTGRWRKQSRLHPEDLAERVRACGGSDVSLVFGNEVSGLTDEELALCHSALAIPSSPLFPSLNLAQAVGIVAYVLYRGLEGTGSDRPPVVTDERVGVLTAAILSVFERLGFFHRGYDSGVRELFRDVLARASLSEAEAARIEQCYRALRALVDRRDPPAVQGRC